MTKRTMAAGATLLTAGAAFGQTAMFMGGGLIGTADSQLVTTTGSFSDGDGAGFSTLNSTQASGGTDSGLVDAAGSVMGSASFNAEVTTAESGISRIVVDAFAESRIDNVTPDLLFASQSIAIGPGGVGNNFLFIEVDQDTEFEFIVEVLNPNEVSTSSITFSAGSSGTLLAGESYLLTWSLGAFATTNGSLFDDVQIRATILLPTPGVATALIACGALAARRRR
jgi:hypothetical protein